MFYLRFNWYTLFKAVVWKLFYSCLKFLKKLKYVYQYFYSVGRCFRFFKLGVGLGCLGVVLFFLFYLWQYFSMEHFCSIFYINLITLRVFHEIKELVLNKLSVNTSNSYYITRLIINKFSKVCRCLVNYLGGGIWC